MDVKPQIEALAFHFERKMNDNQNNLLRSNYNIAGWMTMELKLSGPKLNLFALIFSFSKDGKTECYGSIDYMKIMTGLKRRTVISHLKEMTSAGLIIKIEQKGRTPNKYRANLDHIAMVQKLHYEESNGADSAVNGAKNVVPIVQNMSSYGANAAPNNTSINLLDNTKDKNALPVNFKKWTLEQFQMSIKQSLVVLHGEGKSMDKHKMKDFYEYWIENDAAGKMRFQLQKTWNTKRRIGTWMKKTWD